VSGQWEYARLIARIESRVTSVERRLRDAIGSAIKFFIDLEDVKARTDALPSLTEGQVWGINANGEWDIITPAGGGPYSMIRLSGYEDATYWTEWSEASGVSAMTEDAGYGLSGIDVMAAIDVPATGIYHVSASVDASAAVALVVSVDNGGIGWSHVSAAECRDHGFIKDDGTDGASGALDFPIVAGSRIFIRVTTAGTATWWLAAHWIAPLAIEGGTCGE